MRIYETDERTCRRAHVPTCDERTCRRAHVPTSAHVGSAVAAFGGTEAATGRSYVSWARRPIATTGEVVATDSSGNGVERAMWSAFWGSSMGARHGLLYHIGVVYFLFLFFVFVFVFIFVMLFC